MQNAVTQTQIEALPGFSATSAVNILEKLPAFIQWLRAHTMLRVETTSHSNTTEHVLIKPPANSKLIDKIIVFTGFRDKALEEKITKLGGKVVDNITSTTDIIIAKDRLS